MTTFNYPRRPHVVTAAWPCICMFYWSRCLLQPTIKQNRTLWGFYLDWCDDRSGYTTRFQLLTRVWYMQRYK